MVRVSPPRNRGHRGEYEDLKERDNGGCDIDDELRENRGVCGGLWVGEEYEKVEESRCERERRDERVEGAEEESESCAVGKGSKEGTVAVGAAAAAVECIWQVEFGGDTDEGPDLDGGVSSRNRDLNLCRRKQPTETSHM